MRVVNICTDDYANYSYMNAKALRSVGIDAKSYVVNPHPYGYKKQSEVFDPRYIKHITKGAIVQVMHSDPTFSHLADIVYHTGTRYRQRRRAMDRLFRRSKKVYNMAEFKDCGGLYVVNVADTSLEPSYAPTGKIRHHPSNPRVKGTDKIVEMCPEVVYTRKPLKHSELLESVKDCDIYLEMFAPTQSGKQYGSFGVSAMEAACLGKIVLTNFFYKDFYESEYGELGLEIANTEEEFRERLEELKNLPMCEKLKLQKKSRKWAEKHSLEETGKRLLSLFE